MVDSKEMRQITVRFPEDVYDAIAQAAEDEDRSLAGMLRVIAARYVRDLNSSTAG